jgi:hypothetical protein
MAAVAMVTINIENTLEFSILKTVAPFEMKLYRNDNKHRPVCIQY